MYWHVLIKYQPLLHHTTHTQHHTHTIPSSPQVRELDLAQNRVHDTMRRIHMVVDRSSCIDGVRDALSEGDLERAAQCVARFLELEEATRDIADASSTQAQEQRQVHCLCVRRGG